MNIISAEKLTKYYGKNRGVIGLNLTVDEGEVRLYRPEWRG